MVWDNKPRSVQGAGNLWEPAGLQAAESGAVPGLALGEMRCCDGLERQRFLLPEVEGRGRDGAGEQTLQQQN